MEVNKPDRGVFKGMGRLEQSKFVNKKYFPHVRNIHQFQYTHNHPLQYKTSFQSFKPYDKHQYKYKKINKYSNQSHIQLGNDKLKNIQSQARQHYRKYNFSLPPKPIIHKEQGVGINEYSNITGQKIGYSTTCNDSFVAFRKLNENQNIKYKYTRSQRFNPITGQFKTNTTYGFQDFVPQNKRAYKAHNLTVIPSKTQKYDIISGRNLQF